MARGNVGNLLQHFIAIRVAHQLAAQLNNYKVAIEFIDCYSMAPWEALQPSGTPQRRTFLKRISALRGDMSDPVASAFRLAWSARFGPNPSLELISGEYPNTAVLFRQVLPEQAWHMRLHDVNVQHRKELNQWCEEQEREGGKYQCQGQWLESSLLKASSIPSDRPTLILLDPYRIVPAESASAKKDGYLGSNQLRYLFGQHMLDLATICESPITPCIVLLFSYSEQDETLADRVVRNSFTSDWSVEHVSTGPLPDNGRLKSHQCWIVSKGTQVPVLGQTAQFEWDNWIAL